MKYEIQVTGGMFSVADAVDDILRNEETALTELEENFGVKVEGGSIENDGFGKLLGKVFIESENVISSRVVDELAQQFAGLEFDLVEVKNEAKS
jgi:hypothetical protein